MPDPIASAAVERDVLDFQLEGLEPADADSEFVEQHLWTEDLTVLAQHRTSPHGSHDFVVAHDTSATWGAPGEPQVVALVVARDFSTGTFTMERSCHATVAFAQNWLVERGCAPEQITLKTDGLAQPGDDLTLEIERRIRESGSRYEVLDTYTRDDRPAETWTLTRDAQAEQLPVRLFLEQFSPEPGSYTLREGAFADEDAAQDWLEDRDTPLPQPPAYRGEAAARLTRAAVARSTGITAPKAPADRAVAEAPAAGAAPSATRGRAM